MFVDSGAHSLYNIHVLKHTKRVGKSGRVLARPKVAWGAGDFSYYDLKKGTPFREYCDEYAKFMKAMLEKDPDILLANIDAISNPKLTWEIQRYFEDEHGVQPIPIVHCHCPMEWVDKYVESDKYTLMGVGGLGQGISKSEYFDWGDRFFTHICPKSNDYKPVIRTHGFAMTSLQLICRWPWWSVDSATWVKLSAYGWIYVPISADEGGAGFLFDKTPLTVNFSRRPGKKEYPEFGMLHTKENTEAPSPRALEEAKHWDNLRNTHKRMVKRWLDHIGMDVDQVNDEEDNKEMDLTNHHRSRSIANLKYLTDLQDSRPKWPWPLSAMVRKRAKELKSKDGFGL